MKLKELLDKHRTYYLENFKKLLNQSEEGVSELLIENKSEEPDVLFRLYRYDLVTKTETGHKIVEFNTDGFLNHSKIEYELYEKIIDFHPIVWNGVDFTIEQIGMDFQYISDWAYKWLDINDEFPIDSDKLQGVVHNISKPVVLEDELTFSVDFGTSPIESTMELIEIILKNNSVKRLKLESTWMTEN